MNTKFENIPTPRTDAEIIGRFFLKEVFKSGDSLATDVVPIEYARQLERELHVAKKSFMALKAAGEAIKAMQLKGDEYENPRRIKTSCGDEVAG